MHLFRLEIVSLRIGVLIYNGENRTDLRSKISYSVQSDETKVTSNSEGESSEKITNSYTNSILRNRGGHAKQC